MRVHKPQGARSRGIARGQPQRKPVHHQPVHAPAQGGQREEQANPPPKKTKNDRKDGKQTHLRTGNSRAALSDAGAHTCQPGGTEESRRDGHTTAKPHTHSTEAGNPPRQATPWATPTGPTDRTPRDHTAQPNGVHPEEAAHHDHAATDRPDEKTPRTRQHTHPLGKRLATDHGDADTTRTAKEQQTKGGGD